MKIMLTALGARARLLATARAAIGAALAWLLVASAPAALADTILWANDGRGNPIGPVIEEWDVNVAADTATLLKSFVAPDPAAQNQGAQGIAIVGSDIYYSVFTSGSVFLTNVNGANLGVAFTTGLPGISTIATDGRFLYLGGTTDHNVYKYTLAGMLISTVSLVPSQRPNGFGRDGLELVGNDFVASQQQDIGPYDRFASDGTLVAPMFIGSPDDFGKTGIAFDGTNYFVFDDEATPSQLVVYDSSGSPIERVTLGACPGPNVLCDIRDLSVAAPAVPEPMTLTLLGTALLIFGVVCRRRDGTAINRF